MGIFQNVIPNIVYNIDILIVYFHQIISFDLDLRQISYNSMKYHNNCSI